MNRRPCFVRVVLILAVLGELAFNYYVFVIEPRQQTKKSQEYVDHYLDDWGKATNVPKMH